MLPILQNINVRDEHEPRVKNCQVGDDFGGAREWLIYESQAYFIQLIQLILMLMAAEFYGKNIYKLEQKTVSPDFIKRMMNSIRDAKLENIIIVNDKDEKQMTKLENKLQKEISLAQYCLDNISEEKQETINNTAEEKEIEKNKQMNLLLKKFMSDVRQQSEAGDNRSSKSKEVSKQNS